MKFQLVDDILSRAPDRIVAIKQVSLAEEYLADHFPSYPIMPGVLMLETMVQAARQLLADRADGPLVLGSVKAMKYGSMVRPGEALEVDVSIVRELEDGSVQCRGTGRVRRRGEAAEETAVSGRFTMRPIRRQDPAPAGARSPDGPASDD